MITKTKTIKMLLYDGSLNGVTNISDSAWESGKMYSAPRESISALVSKADCKKYGVYYYMQEFEKINASRELWAQSEKNFAQEKNILFVLPPFGQQILRAERRRLHPTPCVQSFKETVTVSCTVRPSGA